MTNTAATPTSSAKTPARPAPASGKNTTVGSATKIGGDMNTFLKMLSVQMRNQDPLNPMQSEDFAVQLATFSGVEQQVLTNDLLKNLIAQRVGNGLATYSGWIGMEAPTDAPVTFNGSPLTITPQPKANATHSRLNVLTEGGRVVQSIPLPKGNQPLQWAGVGEDGTTLPAGTYRFETESFNGETSLGKTKSGVYQRIAEVRMEGTSPRLVMAGGQLVDPATVTGLRTAPS